MQRNKALKMRNILGPLDSAFTGCFTFAFLLLITQNKIDLGLGVK